MFSSRLIFVKRCFSYHKLPIYSVYHTEKHGSLELAIIVNRQDMTKVENYIEFKLYLLSGNMFIMHKSLINDNFRSR